MIAREVLESRYWIQTARKSGSKSRVSLWRDLHDQQPRDARPCPFNGTAPQCGQSSMSGHARCLSTHRLQLELQMLLITKFK